jgi:prevent-host-death family protein
MNRMNIRDARRRLSEIVDAAERGESTVITRRGRQVACVEPVRTGKGAPLPDLSQFRSSIRVKGKPLSKLVVERRRQGRY